MKNETSLVVGGAGFLGSSLCEALAEAGQQVRAFDRIALPLLKGSERIEWARGDFFNPEDLRKALKGCRTVYHLVSTTVPGTSNLDSEKDVRQNIEGSLRLIELALAEQVRLVDAQGQMWGERLPRPRETWNLAPPATWAANEIIRSDHDVNLNPLTPPGRYQVAVAVLGPEGNPQTAVIPLSPVEIAP